MILSDQALGAVMMALQKSLLEQSDIVPVLKSFDFQITEGGELAVSNPPVVNFDNATDSIGVDEFDKNATAGSD
jgi:hypothetical protein